MEAPADNGPNFGFDPHDLFELATKLASANTHKSKELSHPNIHVSTSEDAPESQPTHQVAVVIRPYHIVIKGGNFGGLTVEYQKEGYPSTPEERAQARGEMIASSLGLDLITETQARLFVDFLEFFNDRILSAETPDDVTQDDLDQCRDLLLDFVEHEIDDTLNPDDPEHVEPDTVQRFKDAAGSMTANSPTVSSGLYDEWLDPDQNHYRRNLEVALFEKSEGDNVDRVVSVTYSYSDRPHNDGDVVIELIRFDGHVLVRRSQSKLQGEEVDELAKEFENLTPEQFIEPQSDYERLLRQGYRLPNDDELAEMAAVVAEAARSRQ
ncbi:MAG TPA: hypothetical protein VG964_01680 [Candidatus Saccharimonadales bacterium]|nr:hypothetical protein [Candidatus Saccharimonadales bacterium]